ncbi:hypothetical protein BGX34_001637 [Mortierella sp. NVP85]|nr:hypothetical protein BGX34_001637 [Mortierella sp. NVP85]
MNTVAEGDSIDLIQEELGYLSVNAHDYIQGKITSKKIARWLRGSSSPNALSRPFRQDDDDEEIQDEEGYLSDLSTVSNEEMGRTYNTLAGGRLLRRAISLEDIKKGSAIRHLMLHEDPIQRPASSASVSPPIPSDTLPAHHHHHHSHLHTMHDHDHQHHGHQLEPPYELEFHQYATSTYGLNRARSAMSMHPNEDDYPLYNTDSYHNSHSGKPHFYDRDLDDSLTMFGSKAPMDYLGLRGRSGDEGISGADRDEPAAAGPLGWLNASPILDAIVSWVEGPAQRSSVKKSDKPNPILDIPFQFIALLTFPEPDPKAGNKMSLAMVRETAFVKQRRKTLMMFTAYTLLVRYCSFDFFLVLLFASNCGLLFLMKNSGRMNVNMAKRAVNQRVGWAKQWAGGIFKKGQGSGGHGQESGAQQQPYHTSNGMGGPSSSAAAAAAAATSAAHPSSKPSPPTSSAAHAESIRNVAPSMAGDRIEGHPQEEGTQVKKRGLFGKRKTTNPSSTAPNGTAPQNGSGSGPVVSLLLDSAHGGDEASIMTGRQKRGGFFKRSSGTSSRSATAPPGTIASAVAAIHSALPPVTKSLTASNSTSSNIASSQTGSTAQQNTAPTTTTTTATTAATSSQAQTQAQAPLQQVPARPPSPGTLRKESTSPKPCVVTPPPSNHVQQHPIDSPPSSGTASMTSSPKAMPTVIPPPQPIARSLSSIHPRSFLAGFSLSQKQQNTSKSNPPSIMSVSTSASASNTTSTNNTTSETALPTAFAPGIIISTTTVPISPRPLNATRLSMPVSILVGSACTTSTTTATTITTTATAAATAAAAVDQLEVVAPALFEGDDVEESLVLPASKYSTLPDTLVPASTTGSMAPTTAPPTLDHHQESSHKPVLPMTIGCWSTTKEGVLEAVATTTATAAVAVVTRSQDAVESTKTTTTTTTETPSGEA